jgi:hypothetical protein
MTAAAANFHDVNATDDTKTNTKDKASKKKGFFSFGGERKERKLGWWGATWRFTLCLVIFVAATVAIVFGTQYAVAYIAGLGLSTLSAGIWSAVVSAIGFIILVAGSQFSGNVLGNIIVDYYKTKAAE